MTPEDERQGAVDRLRRLTGAAVEEASAEARRLERRADEPPAPGDLFVLRQTPSDLHLEWAIIEQDPHHPRRLLVVPADLEPFDGRGDVRAPARGGCGPLHLRTAYGVWLDVEVFDLRLRTGMLDPEVLAEVLEKRRVLEDGTLAALPPEQEIGASPEHRRWRESLLRAQSALQASVGPVHDRTAPSSTPRTPSSSRRFRRSTLALAASLVLAVGLGVVGIVRHYSEMGAVAARHSRIEQDLRDQIVELERARLSDPRAASDVAASAPRVAGEPRPRSEPVLAGSGRRDDAGGAARSIVNLPFFYFTGSPDSADLTVRGGGPPLDIRLPPGAEHYLLLLPVRDPRPFDRYRLEISPVDSEAVVWSNGELELAGPSELSVALPRDLLPEGEYRLRAYGVAGDDQSELIEEWGMRLLHYRQSP